MVDRPIFDAFPSLRDRLHFAELGELRTPVQSLAPIGVEAWVKRDDLTSEVYGGNKVRTLEVLFGQARQRGATHIYSTGAFGSNHAVATVLHAPRAGLVPGVILFPQPVSQTARDNLQVNVTCREHVKSLFHWSALPFGMYSAERACKRDGHRPVVMVPGGATPHGGLGYVSAALEVAHQVAAHELPQPRRVVVGVGSTCTSAGLLVGFHHAVRLGIGLSRMPQLASVRVTPWPVTAPYRILSLATRIAAHLADLAGDDSLRVDARELRPHLTVDGRFLGRGYGHPTPAGRHAIERFRAIDGFELDTTYSAKAAAALLSYRQEGAEGPMLFWSTKSTAPLPELDRSAVEQAPSRMRSWLARSEAD